MKLTHKLGIYTKFELLILPTLLFVFIINFHQFQWYRNSYKKAVNFIQNIPIENRYERIQSQNPYNEIYQLSKEYKGKENRVIFVFYNQNDENFDYVSTYFVNKNNQADQKIFKQYMSELRLFINYFFYPYPIITINPSNFKIIDLSNIDVIISDVDLTKAPLTKKILSQIREKSDINVQTIFAKEALIANKRPENTYFIHRLKPRGLKVLGFIKNQGLKSLEAKNTSFHPKVEKTFDFRKEGIKQK